MPQEKFKVWVSVERENANAAQPSEEYTDIDPGFAAEGEFDTQEEALELAERIHAFSAMIQTPHEDVVGGLAAIMRLFAISPQEVSREITVIREETQRQHTPTEGRRRS